jgi:hypothetical protein
MGVVEGASRGSGPRDMEAPPWARLSASANGFSKQQLRLFFRRRGY